MSATKKKRTASIHDTPTAIASKLKRAAKKHNTPRSQQAKPGAMTSVKGRALKSRQGSRPVGWALEDE